MSLKKNVIANYLGSGVQALLGFAFLPIYIRYIGVEAYGLVGILALLQAWLGSLDVGMRPALAREMARFTAGAHGAESIRDLIRSVEIAFGAICALIVVGVAAASRWLASDWVRSQTLAKDVLVEAFIVMAFIVALRLFREIYISCLAGLQRQVLLNTLIGGAAIVRAFGAIAVLAFISPTIKAFLIWEAVCSFGSLVVLVVGVYSVLPRGARSARFSVPSLRSIWRFAVGSTAITTLALMLTQIDKIILSRMLTLTMFGYYSLAGVVAGALFMGIIPISGAYYPRFTQLVTLEDELTLRRVYHQAAQLITVIAGSAAAILVAFSHPILLAWTASPEVTRNVAPLLVPLVLGTLLNCFMWMPYQMQLAYGWTSLSLKVNLAAVIVLVPAIILIVPVAGAIGAAWVWVVLNLGYVFVPITLMHRRILRTEKWRWYFLDIALPLCAIAIVTLLCRELMPAQLTRLPSVVFIGFSALCVLAAGAWSARAVRPDVKTYLSAVANIARRKFSYGR